VPNNHDESVPCVSIDDPVGDESVSVSAFIPSDGDACGDAGGDSGDTFDGTVEDLLLNIDSDLLLGDTFDGTIEELFLNSGSGLLLGDTFGELNSFDSLNTLTSDDDDDGDTFDGTVEVLLVNSDLPDITDVPDDITGVPDDITGVPDIIFFFIGAISVSLAKISKILGYFDDSLIS
jgi:hypothetical protein